MKIVKLIRKLNGFILPVSFGFLVCLYFSQHSADRREERPVLIYVPFSQYSLCWQKEKKCPMWELQVKFHWGQYEDCSLGDSPSGSSEQLFQRGKGGRSGEGDGTPLRYSCLENPMDGGAWWATVHGVAESRTRLSDFTFTFHSYALEKEMATHSSVLAWRIPGTGEPGGLPSMGSHRVRHDWSDYAAAAEFSWVFFL